MAAGTGFWGKALKKAKEAKDYLLERLAAVAWFLLLFLILSVALIKILGLEDSYGTLVSSGFLGTMLAVFGQNLSHRYRQYATGQDKLKRAVDLLGKAVRKDKALLSLSQVLRDLELQLCLEPGEEVVIEHLGIHMEHSWGQIAPLLERIAAGKRLRSVRYDLLMLCRAKGRKAGFPRPINDLLDIAKVRARMIGNALAELNRTLPAFHGELRFYCEIPVIHGFRVRKPMKVAYVAISRWSADPGHFDAATTKYHRVDTPELESQGDLMAVLDAYFRHYWKVAENTRPHPPVPTAPIVAVPVEH